MELTRDLARRVAMGILSCAALGVLGCEGEAVRDDDLPRPMQPLVTPEGSVKATVELIQELPPWSDQIYGEAEVEGLRTVAAKLAAGSHEDVRRAVEFLTHPERAPGGDLQDASKVFVVLRVLFALPAKVEGGKSYGGWIRPVDPEGEYSVSWPVLQEGGKVVSVARCMGYVGAPYDGAGELDYFRENFPLREF